MSLVSSPGRSSSQIRPAASCGVEPVLAYGVGDQVRDADPGGPGAEDHDLLIGQPAARDLDARERAGEADRGGALDVVVERALRVAVALQDAACLRAAKSSQCRIAFGKLPLAAAT